MTPLTHVTKLTYYILPVWKPHTGRNFYITQNNRP